MAKLLEIKIDEVRDGYTYLGLKQGGVIAIAEAIRGYMEWASGDGRLYPYQLQAIGPYKRWPDVWRYKVVEWRGNKNEANDI